MNNLIEARVLEYLKQAADEMSISTDINREQRLSELSIDSMKLVEIVFELEKTFNLEVGEEALGRVQTVRDLIEVIEQSARHGNDVNRRRRRLLKVNSLLAVPYEMQFRGKY